jgi:hypothetical protein
MTLHVLSRRPEIYGGMHAASEQSGLVGFHVKTYRDGETEDELLEGIERLQQEQKFYADQFRYIKFVFRLTTQSNRDSMEVCVKNLRVNAVPAVLFCPEISSFEIFD